MSDKDTIRKSLEAAFDIPFSVQTSYDKKEPVFMLAPEDPGKELFCIRVSFRNQIRIMMDFIPQKYSVNFIHSMGERADMDRDIFSSYYQLMKTKGAKMTVKVNGSELNVTDIKSWPKDWSVFEARATKMPVIKDGIPDYTESVQEWGSLMMGMVLALADIVPVEEEQGWHGYSEGDARRVELNRYERNPLNRKLCLAAKGYECAICGFDFEKVYGKLGYHFIHVHHITPVSQVGSGYMINPMKDLIPVCPNCHAMLHRSDPPLQPEQLEKIVMTNKKEMVYCDPISPMSVVAESKVFGTDDKKDDGNNKYG